MKLVYERKAHIRTAERATKRDICATLMLNLISQIIHFAQFCCHVLLLVCDIRTAIRGCVIHIVAVIGMSKVRAVCKVSNLHRTCT